jgi:tetratricopeptide (TPR) repeat protein
MTTETETKRSSFFVLSLLPWAAAAGMVIIYFLTLNHLPSASNSSRISELAGWSSGPRYHAPLTFLLTYPLRWLPVGSIGMGLNIFTLCFAGLTLALLARSVALLPHDRTHEQRLRELSPSALLSIRTAWLPPLFAVLVCGLQMSFWQGAVNAAGDVLDLLLFAYCIRCLLEYRVSLRESWMARFAFVYGLGMANGWAMVGMFPGFLAAVIWIRGLSFFNTRFLVIASLSMIAGLSLILLFPILRATEHVPGLGFWQVLHYIITGYRIVLGQFSSQMFLLLSLTSFLPVFVIAIKWASYFGDSSRIGIFLATFTFHVVHALFLLACLWVAFDPPVSPRHVAYGIPLLPLYYLGALSIGYFAGYFLLVFGSRPPKERHRPPAVIQCVNWAVVGSIWCLAISVPVFLVWINLPQIRAVQTADAAFVKLSALTGQALPERNAVVFSDDFLRLSMLEILPGNAVGKGNLFIDTGLLKHDSRYIRQLEREYPAFNLAGYLTNWNPEPPFREVLHLIQKLGEKHDIYYIHPSFGFYFERFYLEPHGPVYQMKLFDTNTWQKPPPTDKQIADNEAFWQKAAGTELPVITNLLGEPRRAVSPLLQAFMDNCHLSVETNSTAVMLGTFYARSIDYWGVELERAGHLQEAATCFAQALQFNPESIAAQVNSKFNETLRTGKKITIEQPAAVRDEFGKFRSWTDLLTSDGPFDDPSFCFELGVTFAAGENYQMGTPAPRRAANYLQAIHEFERVHALVPDYPDAIYWLCQLFLRFGRQSQALPLAQELLKQNPADPKALYYEAVALMQLKSYDKALVPLNHLLAAQTNNYSALMERAISHLELEHYDAAKADYETLAKVAPNYYQIDYGLQEVAFHQKDTNAAIKYIQLYLTNYYQSFPQNVTNFTPPETEEVKTLKQRLKELKNSAP